jgi:hypothetical protein
MTGVHRQGRMNQEEDRRGQKGSCAFKGSQKDRHS